MTSQQRQTLMVSIAVIALIGFGWLIVWFYTLASMTITTNSTANTIHVRQSLPNGLYQKVDVSQRGTRAELRVSPGTYIVTVTSPARSATKIVTLGIGEHKDINLNVESTPTYSKSEPVTSMGAGSVAVSKDNLRFIDRNTANNILYSVDTSGIITRLDKSTRYTRIAWADPAFGLGYGVDKDNNYVITKIEGNFATPLKLPFTASLYSTVGVAPNHTWYVSDGQKVYRGNADGSFTNVYSSSQNVGILTVSNDTILLWQRQKNATRGGNLIALHTDGTKYQVEGEVYNAAWSPSGKKLLLSGDTSGIYDDTLRKIGILPSNSLVSPVWLDDNTVVYSDRNNVMQYDVEGGSETPLLSYDSTTGRPTQISFSQERDYLYVTIQKGGNRAGLSFKLERLALNHQPASDLPLQQLNLLIPNTVSGCELNFINFKRFSVVTSPSSSSTNCAPIVKKYLASYKIGMTNISFQRIK